jgi:hypothetical protein
VLGFLVSVSVKKSFFWGDNYGDIYISVDEIKSCMDGKHVKLNMICSNKIIVSLSVLLYPIA